MAKKLYVGNLSFDTTDEELRETFSKAGNVESASVLKDKMTGRSRGFGFVEMSSDEEAAAAIEMFNGKELGGRTLTVNEARPMTERPPRRAGGFSRGGGRGGFGGGHSDY
ncbi:RNA-binding protein [Candidatus Parcubacteria bacterium]|nr:RNA-binding protein [Candidatus Parcubacteria bacterium]